MTEEITKPLRLSGRYFSKKDIAHVQQTAKTFPDLSRTELAATLCENLNWVTAKGSHKINACLKALEKLETLGYVSLPPKRQQKKREYRPITQISLSYPGTPIECDLSALGSIQLELATDNANVAPWNELVDRYHYLEIKGSVPNTAYLRLY